MKFPGVSIATTAATLVAPVVPAACFAAGSFLDARVAPEMHLITFPLIYLASLQLMMFVGLPVFLVARWLQLANLWTSAVAGLVAGLVMAYLLESPAGFSQGNSAAKFFGFMASVGLLTGVAFWVSCQRFDGIKPKAA